MIQPLYIQFLGESVTNGIQRLGLDFVYVPHIQGTGNAPQTVAEDVMNILPSNIKGGSGYGGLWFCGVHESGGERMFWGYFYGNKTYMTMFICDYTTSTPLIRVLMANGTYTIKTIKEE